MYFSIMIGVALHVTMKSNVLTLTLWLNFYSSKLQPCFFLSYRDCLTLFLLPNYDIGVLCVPYFSIKFFVSLLLDDRVPYEQTRGS